MLDIVIPILNEEKILAEKAQYFASLNRRARIKFVDGGSTDQSVKTAQMFGKVVHAPAGRGIQKNKGASHSQADHLLFLHVDTVISESSLENIELALQGQCIGGCLTMRIQDKGLVFRLYEAIVNIRARYFGVIDGDLGTFVRRDVFDELGGFDELPYMEDILFGQKLRNIGNIIMLSDRIEVSSRKWHKRGFVRTFWDYTLAYLRLWTGTLMRDMHPRPVDYSKKTATKDA